MRLEGMDCAVGDITEMDISGHELEPHPPLIFDVELVGCTALFVKDLEVNNMATICEAGHDLICGGKAVVVVAGFKWLHQDNIGFRMVVEHEEVVAALGANREPAHVISVKFVDGIGCYVELL